MPTKTENFIREQLKTNLSDVRPGDTVKIYQKIKDGDKERTQIFEGLVIARKHGKEAGAAITVRKVVSGVGVEKIIPIHSPVIDKIEIIKRGKVRRAKLYYIREARGRKARLKRRDFAGVIPEESAPEKKEAPEDAEENKESPEVKKSDIKKEEKKDQ